MLKKVAASKPEDPAEIFAQTAVTNIITVLLLLVAFGVLRRRYPAVYSNNVLRQTTPSSPPDTMCSWVAASLQLTLQEVIDSAGLDAAMMLEFTHVGMKVFAILGILQCITLCPMNFYYGGNQQVPGYFKYLALACPDDKPVVPWSQALAVWAVVLIVTSYIFSAQDKFLPYRLKYLADLQALQSHSILVKGIPEELRTDRKLADFFNKYLPSAKQSRPVQRAYVIRETDKLLQVWTELLAARKAFSEAEATWAKEKKTEGGQRPQTGVWCGCFGEAVDSIDHYWKQIEELSAKVQKERDLIMEGIKEGTPGFLVPSGFVTFSTRVSKEIALRLQGWYRNADSIVITEAPAQGEIIWDALMHSTEKRRWGAMTGYSLIALLFIVYTPLIVGITNVAQILDMGPFQTLWNGIAPTLGLSIMVSFLPTLLMLILHGFFFPTTVGQAQHNLQIWYFLFQVAFVIFGGAIGPDVARFALAFISSPGKGLTAMAEALPGQTPFFLNYLVIYWMDLVMCLLRLPELSKFKVFSRIFSEKEAHELSEPEDQDYFGIGARSARLSILMTVGIVFGTFFPPLCLLCSLDFAFTRVAYGYMLVFAETRKEDLGGQFWVSKLRCAFAACALYSCTMAAFLLRQGELPALLALGSFFYVLFSAYSFERRFLWHRLPFTDMDDDSAFDHVEVEGEYCQDEIGPVHRDAVRLTFCEEVPKGAAGLSARGFADSSGEGGKDSPEGELLPHELVYGRGQ